MARYPARLDLTYPSGLAGLITQPKSLTQSLIGYSARSTSQSGAFKHALLREQAGSERAQSEAGLLRRGTCLLVLTPLQKPLQLYNDWG